MNLKSYFKKTEGTGILATSDKKGAVDVAVYGKPHIMGRNKVAFIMKDRLSHRNIRSNSKAAYLFKVKGQPAKGLRLYLTMTKEETDPETVLSERRRTKPPKKDEKLFLVHFRITKARALVGDKDYKLT